MNPGDQVFLRPAHQYQRGQALIFVMFLMTALLGLAALVADYGLVYLDQTQLNASTQAAALAGAEAMAQPSASTTSVAAAVNMYSSQQGDQNATSRLSGVSLVAGYPVLSCLTTLQSKFGISCYGPSASNAIVVQQQVSVPLFMPHLYGLGSVTLTATATASMRGSSGPPLNIVMIVDTTSSMNTFQNSADCTSTALNCALAGVQVLLQNLSPCPANLTTCVGLGNGNVANAVDRVSLFTFPAVETDMIADDYNCSGTNPTTQPFLYPQMGATAPIPSTYQVVYFSSDYRTSDSSSSLNTNSKIVASVGGVGGCPGMSAPGGQGTYYAEVINEAQTYLVSERGTYPGSKNVIILLSDGSANAACTASSGSVCTMGPMTGASTTAATGAYPPASTLQQCAQAVSAAQAAWAAGTTIYAVNFGAEATGCTTDTSPTISPCQTMLQMATYPPGSTSTTYFSDDPAGGTDPSCIAAARPTSGLNQIFTAIAGDFTYARLIPNGTN